MTIWIGTLRRWRRACTRHPNPNRPPTPSHRRSRRRKSPARRACWVGWADFSEGSETSSGSSSENARSRQTRTSPPSLQPSPPAEGEVPPETAAPTEPDAPAEEAAPTEPDAPEEEAAPAEEETTDAPTGDAEPSEGEEPPKEDRSLFDAEPETGGPEEGEPVEPELTFEPEQVTPPAAPIWSASPIISAIICSMAMPSSRRICIFRKRWSCCGSWAATADRSSRPVTARTWRSSSRRTMFPTGRGPLLRFLRRGADRCRERGAV